MLSVVSSCPPRGSDCLVGAEEKHGMCQAENCGLCPRYIYEYFDKNLKYNRQSPWFLSAFGPLLFYVTV